MDNVLFESLSSMETWGVALHIVSAVALITSEQLRKGIHRVRPLHLCICSLQCLIKTYMSPERPLLCSQQSKQKWDVRNSLWPCSFEGIHLEYIWTSHQSSHLKCRGVIFYLISFLLLILLHGFRMLMLNLVMLREQSFLKWLWKHCKLRKLTQAFSFWKPTSAYIPLMK